MSTTRRTRERVLWYLVPILIGMGGMYFSNQFESMLVRFAVVLISVAVPLFALGNMLARYGAKSQGRVVLLAGVVLLMVGATATLSQFSDIITQQQVFSEPLTAIARWLGMFSLLLGLFVVLFSLVRTGAAIEEVGERFRSLAELMSEGFILSSPNGTIVLVNQRFLDMLGLSEEMVVGENAAELVKRLQVDNMIPHLDMRTKGLASEYEITWWVRNEERQFWISGAPIFDRQGHHTGTLATVRDVTERNRMAKRLERYAKGLQDLVEEQTQKLRQSEEQFRDLLVYMNEGFLTLDSSYRIQFANNRVCELLRTSPQAIRGCEVFDFVDAPGRVKLMELLKAEGADTGVHPEFTFVRTDGVLLAVVASVAPVHDAAGVDTRYSLVITDVSDLKRMQRQLELRAAELEAANEEMRAHGRAKDGFLSNVSHELKTPLSTINGYVEMLESGSLGQLAAPQSSALKVMGRNVKRLVSLINEMIEFSRMEIRGINLKATLFNPASLVRESVASAQPQALAKDLSMSIFVPDGLPSAWGDREKLGQVLGILLSNAVKFSREGGMIQIRASERERHTLAIAVSDTGIGIDPSHHARIFDKFFQVDSSMTRRYEGTGIGLSIAKSVIEAHKGTIELDSEPSKGSTFTIVLPGAVFDDAVPAELRLGMDQLRVLVVGERETMRRAVRTVVTECGCSVSEAKNGYECARLAEETQPAIIVFDEPLLDVGGASAISSLRLNPATEPIPVLALTEAGPPRAQDMLAVAPRVHCLAKPFTAPQLLNCIRGIVSEEEEMPVAMPPRVARTNLAALVVDSDPDLVEWLETALRRRNVTCWSAQDAREALELAVANPPDAIFIGIDAPHLRADEALTLLAASKVTRHIPVCVMCGRRSPNQDLPEGAAAVLQKPFGIDDFLQRLQELRVAPVV